MSNSIELLYLYLSVFSKGFYYFISSSFIELYEIIAYIDILKLCEDIFSPFKVLYVLINNGDLNGLYEFIHLKLLLNLELIVNLLNSFIMNESYMYLDKDVIISNNITDFKNIVTNI